MPAAQVGSSIGTIREARPRASNIHLVQCHAAAVSDPQNQSTLSRQNRSHIPQNWYCSVSYSTHEPLLRLIQSLLNVYPSNGIEHEVTGSLDIHVRGGFFRSQHHDATSDQIEPLEQISVCSFGTCPSSPTPGHFTRRSAQNRYNIFPGLLFRKST